MFTGKTNHNKVLLLLNFFYFVFTSMFPLGCSLNNNDISNEHIPSYGKVKLSWNSIQGATSYNVYLFTTPGVPNEKSYKIQNAANPIEIRDLDVGATYYFIVIAVHDFGEGEKSNEVSYKVTKSEGYIKFDDFANKSIATDDLTVFFDTNSNKLVSSEVEKLDRVIKLIINSSSYKVILNGYTDSSGEYEYNKMMSKRRAAVVKSYMVGKGIPSNNIETYGHGPVNFLSTNSTVEGRKMNRRVEVKIIQAE